MPYIEQRRRSALESNLTPQTAGELNYVLTRICHTYLEEAGERYATYAEIVSALECAKLELYARFVRPYEDRKILDNGDVRPDL